MVDAYSANFLDYYFGAVHNRAEFILNLSEKSDEGSNPSIHPLYIDVKLSVTPSIFARSIFIASRIFRVCRYMWKFSESFAARLSDIHIKLIIIRTHKKTRS